MKVIERYIMRRMLLLFLGALAWTLAIVWTTQVLARIDLVTDGGQSALTFFEVAALIIPTVIPIVVPFALAGAVAQTLSAMNADSELVVVNAAGASRMTVARPVLILAIAASVFCLLIQNFVEPYARQRNRDLVAGARADFLSLVIQEGTFRKIEDGLFVQIGERLPGNRLAGIFVADSREEGVDLVYYAKTGAVIDHDDTKALLMNDGVIHRKAVGGDISLVHFTSYAFDLSAFDSDTGTGTRMPKDQTTAYLLNPNRNDDVYKKTPQLYRNELHKRFSEWLFPITFALIALAVAGDAKSHREARIHPLVTTICIALFVRWMGYFAEGQTKTQPLFNYALYAVPVAFSAISVWCIATQRTMELPIGWIDALNSIYKRISDKALALRMKLTGAGAHKGSA
ncbi:lipopolysaccharide export system permease protein [Aquamicrobium lusatiense]|jgi:lipopolysaccharide export system permease protein|uniref:Lipopolysaccharide export system permease protein n=1 Tax=Aquamicrobium lusatiense TaxID=89772 RepID=A0A7W9S2T2_9HYPH|nr:LPS export ABC transporter permease LptF [Aquamicrobium lusatiense]MBB6013072.1 lipopolysaccharide export system permease protein [Aquamicrobium lusatiense]